MTNNRKFKNSIHHLISCGFIVIVAGVSLLCYFIIKEIAFPIFLEKEKNKIENIGNSIVLELTDKIKNAETLSLSLANIYNVLEKNKKTFMNIVPAILNLRGYENIIAGGGVWPEPFTFDKSRKLRSFFFGRNKKGFLKYYNDYNNLSGKGYLNEEWYVPAKFLIDAKVYWSRSYIDPYSKQPMVTCTSPIKKNGKFLGTATVDLKLEGLNELFSYYAGQVNGYIFVLDRNNNFLYFPKENFIKSKKSLIKKYINIERFIGKHHDFQPVLKTIKKIDSKIIKLAKRKNHNFNKIVMLLRANSYQIGEKEAEIIAAVLINPLKSNNTLTTKLSSLTLKKDLIFQEPSNCTIFYMPGTYWKIGVVVPEKYVTSLVKEITLKVILFLILGLIIILAIGYKTLKKMLLNPLKEITENLEKKDKINYTSNNELGKLVYYFNKRSNELKESEEYVKAIFEQSPLSMMIFDKNGDMIDANGSWEKLWGLEKDQFIGKYNILKDKILKYHKDFNSIKEVFKGKNFIFTNLDYKLKSFTGKGSDKILNIILFPIRNSSGDILRVVAIQQDLTEKIKIEEELKKMGKLEALGMLSAGIAHDFNNILTSILLNIEMIELKYGNDEKIKKFLNNVKSSLESASKLISRIKMITRKENFDLKPVDLKKIVDEALEIAKPPLSRNIKIFKNFQGKNFHITGDKHSLIQVVMNLIINATDAIEQSDKTYGKIEILLKEEEENILMEVTDSGIGISPEYINKIFEPFFTTKDKGSARGTGLGLSIVFNIVKSLNGKIEVKSHKGKGTTFIMEFSKANGKFQKSKKDEKQINIHNKLKNKTILLVEDEESIINIESLFLESLGFRVIKAVNGVEAVNVIKNNEKIDIVFVDWEMPVMNGEQTILKIKDLKKDIPIFIVSGAINEKIYELKKSGLVLNIIKKPFNKEKIIEKLNNAGLF